MTLCTVHDALQTYWGFLSSLVRFVGQPSNALSPSHTKHASSHSGSQGHSAVTPILPGNEGHHTCCHYHMLPSHTPPPFPNPSHARDQTLAAAFSKGRSKREEQAKAAEGRWQVLVQESQHSLLEDTFINTCVTDVSGDVWDVWGWVKVCGVGETLVQELQHALLEDTFINTCVTDVGGGVWNVCVGWGEDGYDADTGVAPCTAGGHIHQHMCNGCECGCVSLSVGSVKSVVGLLYALNAFLLVCLPAACTAPMMPTCPPHVMTARPHTV